MIQEQKFQTGSVQSDNSSLALPPFPPEYRASGLLLHVSSLPSRYGNELLISPDWLIEEELLQQSACAPPSFPLASIDYGAVMTFKRRAQGNWIWRCTEEMLSAPAFDSLRDLTRSSKRLCTPQNPMPLQAAVKSFSQAR